MNPNADTIVPASAAEPEGSVHQMDDLHRLLVDRVEDYAIFALDRDGYILSWNAGGRRLEGYGPREVIGQHFSVFYPQEDIAEGKPTRDLETAAADGRAESEAWRVRKDGSRFRANILLTALRDDSGELVGFATVTRDLTEQKRVESELRESEDRLRLLIESVRDYAIFMLDPNGVVATWNTGAQRIKGYSAAEIIGKHFSTFYPAEDIASDKPARELEIAVRTGVYEEEGWRIRRDGSRFWANVVITPVRKADGSIAGFAKVTRDLTERRAALERTIADARRIAGEEAARVAADARTHELQGLTEQLRMQTMELDRRRSEAESANRAKSEFLAAMSHELRTPLNAIGGYAQLMQMGISGTVTEEQREHLARIQRSQQHLLGIINDILNFSRIEAGQVEYTITPLSVCEVIDAVTPMIAPQVQENQLTLDVGTCSSEVVASADRTKVEQILLNLLSNAVKFTKRGGEITVSCGMDRDSVWISVRDSGIGIAPDQIEMIFAPFVQVGRTLASPKEGTGLGLAISRDLARAMKGDLAVTSREGRGSTFTLTLPRAAD